VFQGFRPDGYVLINSKRSFDELGLAEIAKRFRPKRLITVAATDIALKHLFGPLPNALLLGGFAALSGLIALDAVTHAIRAKFAGKVAEAHVAAASEAFEAVRHQLEVSAHAEADRGFARRRRGGRPVPARRDHLAVAGERAIREKVIPGFRSLKSFYETRYLQRASQTLGLSKLPGGPMYYQAWLDWFTTTHMTSRQAHELGLALRCGLPTPITPQTPFQGPRQSNVRRRCQA
jgi:hypothetical protein